MTGNWVWCSAARLDWIDYGMVELRAVECWVVGLDAVWCVEVSFVWDKLWCGGKSGSGMWRI